MPFGLKLWSSDNHLRARLDDAALWNSYRFLELTVVPGTFEKTARAWQGLPVPIVIHAPHFGHGMNLSLKECWPANQKFLEETKAFADLLQARFIVVHLGTKGTLSESIRQIKLFPDSRVLVENKPQIALDGSLCVGTSPQDIQTVLQECGVGFCLDISHAIKYARFRRQKESEVLKAFLDLQPALYHLCDGHAEVFKDEHLSIGEGNYDFAALLKEIPPESWITLETPKQAGFSQASLIQEVQRLQNPLHIHIVSDPESWLNEYIPSLVVSLKNSGHRVFWKHSAQEIQIGDLVFYLGYGEIVPPAILKKNRHNLVVHESALPQGRGWSPLTWQILEGKKAIPIVLFEAQEKVDSGPIYLIKTITFNGTELIDELRQTQAKATLEMCLTFVHQFPALLAESKPQSGSASYYRRRKPQDSRLDLDKTIRDQLSLLRVVDNERYPAFFELDGEKYILQIKKMK